jgi:hypothetical protein
MHRSMSTVGLFVTLIGLAEAARAQDPARATKDDIARWSRELSNWGRWGKDDQMGAANLITPAKRKQAAALVKEGVSVSLARDLETDKSEYNPSPFKHTVMFLGSREKAEIVLDAFEVNYHGYAHTHLDARHRFQQRQGLPARCRRLRYYIRHEEANLIHAPLPRILSIPECSGIKRRHPAAILIPPGC